VLTTCQPSTVWCSQERLPAAAAQPAQGSSEPVAPRNITYVVVVVLDSEMVSGLAIGHKVSGFKPSRVLRIFKDDKNEQHDFLRRRSKAIGPMA
jgi:hypothetical protein